MPTRELAPYVEMIPRIAAQRSIAAAEEIAIGMGRLRPEDHRATVARWRRDATAGAPVRRLAPGELAMVAQSHGIGFRTVHVETPA